MCLAITTYWQCGQTHMGQIILRLFTGVCTAVMRVTVREIHITSEPDHHCVYFLRVDSKGRDLGSGFLLLLTDGQDAWRGEGKLLSCPDPSAHLSDLTYFNSLQPHLSPFTLTYLNHTRF